MSERTATDEAAGVIESGAMYRLDEFRRRAGMGEWAVRTARRNGLRVQRVGNVWWVLGRDFIEWVSAQGQDAPPDYETAGDTDATTNGSES